MSLKPYIPVSKGFSLEVSIPESMAYETSTALRQLKAKYGDIDLYVMNKLKYPNKESLHKALAAEQVDAVALAIHNIEKGEGIIIGDQTGIGKGRQAAAIIRYGVVNGYNTLFVTEKSTLFSDLYRDLRDIDSDDFVPYILNTHSKNNPADIRDEDGVPYQKLKKNNNYKAPRSAKEVANFFGELIDNNEYRLPETHDFVAMTYTQVTGDNKAAKDLALSKRRKVPKEKGNQEKTVWLREFMKNAIVVMDESHNAGGLDSTTGFFFREILPTTKGVCFLSATFAKRPDNMPIYALKTSIAEAGLSSESLIRVFEKGGLALQEVAASELVKGGQMVRRQRGFEGIKVIWKMLEKQREKHWEMVDIVTEIMRDIQNFQHHYVKPVVEGINENLFDGTTVEERKGIKNFGANNSDYFNKAHNVIFQLMFSLKAQEVAEEAIRQLEQNKKVVIAFSSTMGSFLSQLGYSDGEEVQRLDFALVLMNGLEAVFNYTIKDTTGDTKKDEIDIEDLSEDGQVEYERIVEKINEVSTGLSVSPIDTLINIIESTPRPDNIGGVQSEFYRVRECTGRNAQIKFEDGIPIYRKFSSEKNAFFREFNNGNADVLLINQSASTGVSAHSSNKFGDQRQRVMIIHQPELNINTEVQKRGRVNRTGQVNKPEYIYISSTVPSELRQFMVLKAKLRSLDANTTGSQEASKSQLDIPDFMNKYGGQVIFKYLQENPELNDLLGNPCYRKVTSWNGEEEWEKIADSDIPRRVTNRVQLVAVDTQQVFYDAILKQYEVLVAEEKEKGTYDLEVEFLDFQAELMKRWLYVEGNNNSTSPFGQNAVLEQCRVKVLKHPFKMKLLKEKIDAALNGKSPDEHMDYYLEKMRTEYPSLIEGKLERRMEKLAKMNEEVRVLQLEYDNFDTAHEDEEEAEKLVRKAERIQSKIETRKKKITEYEDTTEMQKVKLKAAFYSLENFLKVFRIGEVTLIPRMIDGGEITQVGIIYGFEIDLKSENPWTPGNIAFKVALNNDRVSTTLKLSSPEALKARENTRGLNESYKTHTYEKWDALAETRKSKEIAFIATGNIFKALSRASAEKEQVQLVKYKMINGAFRNGIILGKTADRDTDIKEFQIKNNSYFLPQMGLSNISRNIEYLQTGREINLVEGSIIIKKESDNAYRLIVHPKDNKSILVDPEILRMAELTPEQIEQGKDMGDFVTYTGSMLSAVFRNGTIFEVVNRLSGKHGVSIKSIKPIELDIKDADEVMEDIAPGMQLAIMVEMMKMELAA